MSSMGTFRTAIPECIVIAKEGNAWYESEVGLTSHRHLVDVTLEWWYLRPYSAPRARGFKPKLTCRHGDSGDSQLHIPHLLVCSGTLFHPCAEQPASSQYEMSQVRPIDELPMYTGTKG